MHVSQCLERSFKKRKIIPDMIFWSHHQTAYTTYWDDCMNEKLFNTMFNILVKVFFQQYNQGAPKYVVFTRKGLGLLSDSLIITCCILYECVINSFGTNVSTRALPALWTTIIVINIARLSKQLIRSTDTILINSFVWNSKLNNCWKKHL